MNNKFYKFKHTINFICFVIALIFVSVESPINNKYIYGNTQNYISNSITINNLDDFLIFANNCRLDTFSKDKNVLLATDLDLSDVEFTGIPIFLGEFDGAGHTISGLHFDVNDDYQGLFRYTAENSKISNLIVSGELYTNNSTIGGIVAENKGTISNCTFKGIISGISNLGGITGKNIGTIVNCTTNDGAIFGESKIGGIAGENEGTIVRCENNFEVNVNLDNIDFAVNENFSFDINNIGSTIDIINIGGITGINTGIIQNSKNLATIGYPHIGYNIGGIAGIQSGYITNCENYGEILGRKEVGGIVGQFEPYVSTFYSKSDLQTLREEINTLSKLTSNLTENTKANTDVINNDFTVLNESVDESIVQIENLINRTEDLISENVDVVNENIEVINTVSVTFAEFLDDLVPITDTFDDITDNLIEVFDYFKIATDELNLAFEELETVDDISQYISREINKIDNYFDNAYAHIQELETLFVFLQSSNDIFHATYTISLMFPHINNALNELSYIQDSIINIINTRDDIADMLSNSNDQVQLSLDNLSMAFEKSGDTVESLDVTLDLISDLSKKISDEEEIVFVTLTSDYDIASDLFTDSLSTIATNVDIVNNSLNSGVNIFLDDFDAINKQLNVVFNLMIDITENINPFDTNWFEVEDISYSNIDSITAGKISLCNNYGNIDGDINIGGISGAIASENTFDHEDDFKINTQNQNSTRKGVAVLTDCINDGEVISKKDGVGGIAGIQDFGLIIDCISSGNFIESVDGSYVGGIVGNSSATIKNSYSKNTLIGKDYIAGVAGKGYRIENSYTLSPVQSSGGYIGGIAGDLYSDGSLKSNYFVSDSLGGLNGISYGNKAEAITYANLIATPNIPEIFNSMYVKFYIEDVLIYNQQVDFGGIIHKQDYPELPVKDGYYGDWELIDTSKIVSDLKIDAEYVLNRKTLSSDIKTGAISKILVNGNYTDEEYLVVNNIDVNIENFSDIISSRTISEFEIYVDGNISNDKSIDRVRYLMPTDNIKIQIFNDNEWIDVDSTIDSKYIIFDNPLDLDIMKFRVIEENIIDNTPEIISFALFLMILLCFIKAIFGKIVVMGNKQ